MNTPIIILTKERPLQLRDMIESIENVTENPYIIICDNGSIQPEMVDLLKNIGERHSVVYNKENLGFFGLNIGLAMVDTPYFVMSDPDIIMNPETPHNWQDIFIRVLHDYPCPKVGLALDVSWLPNTTMGNKIRGWEDGWWKNRVEIPFLDSEAYYACIDTTFAMYRRDTFECWKDGHLHLSNGNGLVGNHLSQDDYNRAYSSKPIRIAGKFSAIHTGWDFSEKYASDIEFYKNNCRLEIASTIRGAIENGIIAYSSN